MRLQKGGDMFLKGRLRLMKNILHISCKIRDVKSSKLAIPLAYLIVKFTFSVIGINEEFLQ